MRYFEIAFWSVMFGGTLAIAFLGAWLVLWVVKQARRDARISEAQFEERLRRTREEGDA